MVLAPSSRCFLEDAESGQTHWDRAEVIAIQGCYHRYKSHGKENCSPTNSVPRKHFLMFYF